MEYIFIGGKLFHNNLLLNSFFSSCLFDIHGFFDWFSSSMDFGIRKLFKFSKCHATGKSRTDDKNDKNKEQKQTNKVS